MDDPVLSAIKDFRSLLESLEKEESSVGSSFRTRCRELLSIIEDIGLVPTLSFCYAKSKKEIYDDVKGKLEGKDKIKEENHTEKGYAIFLYFTLKRLKDIGLIEKIEDPINALEELRSGKESVASRLLRPYLVQLKRLAEASFKAGERE